MSITNHEGNLVMQCDYCQKFLEVEETNDFNRVIEASKESGWLNRKIDDKWGNYCCQECYTQKAQELKAETVTPLKADKEVINDFAAMHAELDKKINTFAAELEHVSDANKELAKCLIGELPDYFFEIAASSTGKYHPSYTNGNGGLVRHTKAAVRIAIELLRLEMYQVLAPYKDYIIIALILHDGWKHGLLKEDGTYAQYTKAEHPKICAEWIMTQTNLADESVLKFIADLVWTHMGQWNMGYNNGLVFAPKPSTIGQCFVHLCDYLASRKCLEFNFEVPFGV